MIEDLTNECYFIREWLTVGELGFVLAQNETTPPRFVTWCYRADTPADFFGGHYVNKCEDAYADYLQRINDEEQRISENTGKQPLLPALCLSIEPSSGKLIHIRRGVSHYYGSDWNRPGEEAHNRKTADIMNKRWGVTHAQEQAMLAGIMFGWDTPAADPRRYDEGGKIKHTKKRDEQER